MIGIQPAYIFFGVRNGWSAAGGSTRSRDLRSRKWSRCSASSPWRSATPLARGATSAGDRGHRRPADLNSVHALRPADHLSLDGSRQQQRHHKEAGRATGCRRLMLQARRLNLARTERRSSRGVRRGPGLAQVSEQGQRAGQQRRSCHQDEAGRAPMPGLMAGGGMATMVTMGLEAHHDQRADAAAPPAFCTREKKQRRPLGA